MKLQTQRLLLFLIHLLCVCVYLYGIRNDVRYWFAPIAWALMALIFSMRKSGTRETDGRPPMIRLSISIVLLIVALATGQAAYGVFSGILVLHWILKGFRDRFFESFLGYLSAPILFSVRPPVAVAVAVADGLLTDASELATKLASRILDQFQYLHVLSEKTIELTGGNLSVMQIGQSFFSLPAFLCASSVIQCLLRRRLAHAIPVLLVSCGIGIIMQTGMLCASVVALEDYGLHVMSGIGHFATSGAVFVVALIAVISFDQLLSFFTDPVPSITSAATNPLLIIWNRLFLSLPREQPDAETDSEWPSLAEAVREESVVSMAGSWIQDFAASWFETRYRRSFLYGVPFIAVAVVAGLVAANAVSVEEIDARYLDTVNTAIEQGNTAEVDLAISRLRQSGGDHEEFRFQFARQLIAIGKNDEAIENLNALTPLDGNGYAPARLWLVKQSADASALIPLNEEEQHEQFLRAVSEQPWNDEAHQLLAQSYYRRKEPRLAEIHFARATEAAPIHAPDLLTLQQQLGRPTEQLQKNAVVPLNELNQRLKDNPADERARIAVAQIRTILGDTPSAETLLKDGLVIESTETLRNALSNLYAKMAIGLLREPLRDGPAAELSLKAVQLNPSNVVPIAILYRSSQSRPPIDPSELAQAVDYWKHQLELRDDSIQARLNLSQLLTVCGQFDAAVEILKPAAASAPALRVVLVKVYMQAGQTDAAKQVAQEVLAEIRSTEATDENMIVSMAEVLTAQDQLQDVIDLVDARLKKSGKAAGADLSRIYSASVATLYTQKAAAEKGYVGSTESLQLLRRAYDVNPNNPGIAVRLAQVSMSDGTAAGNANALVLQILAQGRLNSAVYSALGTEGILREQYAQAISNLELAMSLSPGDPAILNNLAVALVRNSDQHAVRALDLVEQAIDMAPGHVELLATRGEVYIQLKRLREARADLLFVLEKDPTHEDALRLLQKIE
jgi:tetratricopeptide (TPR) repeat protein